MKVSIISLQFIKLKTWAVVTLKKDTIKNFVCLKDDEKDKLLRELKDIILNDVYPINAIQATELLNSKLNTDYKTNLIRKLLNFELKCSFKKIKSRPSSIDMSKVCALRQLFAIRFWQEILSNSLIVNIDEKSINRYIKWNYFWSLQGTLKETVNSPFVWSISLIMAIWSNGAWMTYLENETINGNKFSNFICNLDKWIKNSKVFDYDNPMIILDNSSVHKTGEVKLLFKKMKAKILFFASYTPQFPPIEMHFGLLKRYLWKFFENKSIHINQKENISIIIRALKEIKADVIVRMFNSLLSLINKIV